MKTTAYSTNTDSDDVSVVDLDAKRETTRIPVGGSPRGAVKFRPQGDYGYVSNCAGNTLSVINLRTNSEDGRITVGLAPRGIAISEDGRLAFVSNSGESTLTVVDLDKRTSVGVVQLGQNPRHMAVLRGKNALLVSEWGADAVAIVHFDALGNTVTKSGAIAVGSGARPYSIAVNKAGDRAYVANTQANYVTVIDISSGKELSRVQVGYGGRAIAFSPDESYAFVSVENSNEICVIDLRTHRVIRRVDVGPSPRGIAVDQSRMILLGGSFGRSVAKVGSRNSLSVVDVSNPQEAHYVGDIAVGLGPCSVAVLQTSD